MSEMLTIKEAEPLLGVNTRRILALIERKQLAAVNVAIRPDGNPRWRIRRDDLEDFIRRRNTFQREVADKMPDKLYGHVEFAAK